MNKPSKSWLLLLIFALGCVVEWIGAGLKSWAGDKLKKRWFPGDDDETKAASA